MGYRNTLGYRGHTVLKTPILLHWGVLIHWSETYLGMSPILIHCGNVETATTYLGILGVSDSPTVAKNSSLIVKYILFH